MSDLQPGLPSVPELPAELALRFRELVQRRAGLVLDERKDEALAAAVAEVAAEHALPGAEELWRACARAAGTGSVLDDLVGRLTIGETHFFRNRPHFEALSEVVFPELFERRSARRELRVWSAGCSSGEETYSLAMTLGSVADRLGVDLRAWSVRLVGTDIDPQALEKARRAEYGRYSFRGVRTEEIERYFEETGEGRWRVRDRWVSLVEFQRFNLVQDAYPAPGTPFHDVDVIVCRNVTIYFSEATTRAVVDRFHDTLADGGYLLVGHSEHSLETYRRFQTRALPDVILYQKGGDREAPPSAADPVATPFFAEPVRRGIVPQLLRRSRRLGAPDVPSLSDALNPGAPPSRLDQARAALQQGDRNRAANLAVEELEAASGSADASLLLGQIAADRGHFTEARIWLERTIELRPLDLSAHYLLAVLYLERGDRPEALRLLEKSLYLDPDLVMAHHLSARIHRDAGRAEAAQRSLKAARRALEKLSPDAEVPFSEGLTAAQFQKVLGPAPGGGAPR